MLYLLRDWYFLKDMSQWSFPDLLEGLDSSKTSQKLPPTKTGNDTVKSGCFQNSLRCRVPIFVKCQIKEGYKIYCVKILIFC